MERSVDDAGRTSQPPPEQERQPHKRIVLMANETVAAPGVRDRIEQIVGGANAEVYVVAPALTRSRFQQVAGDVDHAIEEARERLDATVRALRETGIAATGDIGDSDPNLALDDALRRFPADEIVISTHPPGRSKWLEQDVVERARAAAGIPVTHVVVDMEHGGAEVTDVERSPAHTINDRPTTLYDLPRMPARDYVSIAVGIVGTIVLWVLAGFCIGDIKNEGMDVACAFQIGLATIAFFITTFHVVALFLFGWVRYQGRWASFAADTMLFGIPPAIVASAILA